MHVYVQKSTRTTFPRRSGASGRRDRDAGDALRPARHVRVEALAAGITVFELAKVMGTSVRMIERHYGTLLDGAHAGIVGRLDALEAELEKAAEDEAAES
jgi:hypothetical protein